MNAHAKENHFIYLLSAQRSVGVMAADIPAAQAFFWFLSYERNPGRRAPENFLSQASKPLQLGHAAPEGGTHVCRKSQMTEVKAFGRLREEGENGTHVQVHVCSLTADMQQSTPTLMSTVVPDK